MLWEIIKNQRTYTDGGSLCGMLILKKIQLNGTFEFSDPVYLLSLYLHESKSCSILALSLILVTWSTWLLAALWKMFHTVSCHRLELSACLWFAHFTFTSCPELQSTLRSLILLLCILSSLTVPMSHVRSINVLIK